MLPTRRTSIGGGLLALLLVSGFWILSESADGAFSPGEELSESLTRLDNQLERENAEIKQLEQSIDKLLDSGASGSGGNPMQNLQGSSSGSSSGSSPNTSPQANQPNGQSAHKHHHRRGYMGRGMELARLMYDMERQARRLEREERRLEHDVRKLEHQERSLEHLKKQLAALKKLEKNLHALNNSAKVGKKTSLTQRKAKTGENTRHAEPYRGKDMHAGTQFHAKDSGQSRAEHHSGAPLAGKHQITHTDKHAGNTSKSPASGGSKPPVGHASHTTTGNSHMLSGARGAGHGMAAAHHHSTARRH